MHLNCTTHFSFVTLRLCVELSIFAPQTVDGLFAEPRAAARPPAASSEEGVKHGTDGGSTPSALYAKENQKDAEA